MKAKELKNYLEFIINQNPNAEVRVDFGKEEEMKEYSKHFFVSCDDMGDVLIYE